MIGIVYSGKTFCSIKELQFHSPWKQVENDVEKLSAYTTTFAFWLRSARSECNWHPSNRALPIIHVHKWHQRMSSLTPVNYIPSVQPNKINVLFEKNSADTNHWYPFFGFLVMSPLCFICLISIVEANVMYIPWDPPLVLHVTNLVRVSIVGQ